MISFAAATEEDMAAAANAVRQPMNDYSVISFIDPMRDFVNDHYWERFFDGCEIYLGWKIRCQDGRWWAWDGTEIGTSNCEADCQRAADLFHGRFQ